METYELESVLNTSTCGLMINPPPTAFISSIQPGTLIKAPPPAPPQPSAMLDVPLSKTLQDGVRGGGSALMNLSACDYLWGAASDAVWGGGGVGWMKWGGGGGHRHCTDLDNQEL